MRKSTPLVLGLIALGCGAPRKVPSPAAGSGRGSADGPTSHTVVDDRRAPTPLAMGEPAVVPPSALPVAPVESPAAPSAPAYDLETDRSARSARARNEFGSKTPTAVVSDIFVVIGPPGWQGPAFQQSIALIRNAMAGYMNGRFAKKPEQAISVYLFQNSSSYEQFCKSRYGSPCISHYGFYQPADRSMIMNAGLGLGTLTHELVHPLVESDFPAAPTWLNEGIASVFEAPVIPKPGEIHGTKNWRLPRLRQGMASPTERQTTRLDSLFSMSDETFRGTDEDLHYAMARYVCQWLDDRGKLWPFYQRWRDTVADDPNGAKAFEAVVGMTPMTAHAEWS